MSPNSPALALSSPPATAGNEPIQFRKMVGFIPDKYMEGIRQEMENYLSDEFSRADSERAPHIRKLARWEEAYRAPMADQPKHYPIFNSSNLTIPVIKEAVNTISAQLVQATDTARPRWIFKDLAKEWEPFVSDIEAFMDMASDRDMQLSDPLALWIIEATKLGTSIMEMPWEVDERRIFKYDESGTRAYPSKVVYRDGPAPRHMTLSKFWIRMFEKDIQKAVWVAKELDFNEMELKRKRDQGKFHDIETVLKSGENHYNSRDEKERVAERIEKTTPIKRGYKVFEVWLTYDIDKKGEVETKVYYHRESGKIIGEFFNPYWHGRRPFVKLGFFPHPDRFYDEGICEMLEPLQAAISATVNRRADNAAMANAKMILKRRTVRNLQPGDPLYPLKIIDVNDVNNDVREFQLSEIYPSTVNEEMLYQSRSDRVVGINEGISGAAMPVTRTTASAQIALLQEQAKRIDLAVRNIRRGVEELGWFGMQLYGQYGTGGKAVAWLGTKGHAVDAVFRLPRRVKELGIALQAKAPSSMMNRQVQRENKIMLFNLLLQLHKEIFPLAQQFAPESLPLVAAGAIKGAQKFMGDVLRSFEEPDPEGVLASLSVLEKLLPQMENLGGLDDLERRIETSEILERISGLERLASETEAAAAASGRGSDRFGERKRASTQEGLPSGNGGRLFVGGQPDRAPREGA